MPEGDIGKTIILWVSAAYSAWPNRLWAAGMAEFPAQLHLSSSYLWFLLVPQYPHLHNGQKVKPG